MATATTTQNSHIDDDKFTFVMEQPPEFDGDFCYTHQTDCGHIFLMSDSPGGEFIRLQHANGSYLQFLPSGKTQANTAGDYVHLILKNNKVWIKGSSLVHVDGDANINVGKNAYIGIDGSMTTHIKGSADITCENTLSLNADRINLNSKSGVSLSGSDIQFPSDLTIHGDLNVQQDLNVTGNIQTESAVLAACGLLTPGSLVVGPAAIGMPLEMLVTNFVLINAFGPLGITMLSSTLINATAGGAIAVSAGGIAALTAAGDVAITSGGATEITSGAALLMSAGGLAELSAAGALTLSSSTTVVIEPDVSAGDILSLLGHIHYGVMPGPSYTSPPFPGS
jgi:hypothetical protein